MFITLIHLACDILTRLIALDEGDGLLNFKTVFQPISRDYEGTNAPLIIAIVLCSGVLQFLIRHTIIRVLGTCLVVSCLEAPQHHAFDSEIPQHHDEATPSANVFSLLRKTRLLRARVRRSIAYTFVYSIASGLCSSLASSISESYIWLTLAELATAVLMERVHYRWTNSIVGRTPHAARVYHWRDLLLPTMLYALARKIVAELPTAIGTLFITWGSTSTEAVAIRDIAVLASAFSLRFFVLYPAWAGLICFETHRTNKSTDTARDSNHSYIHVLKKCYEKLLLRLSALHLQVAALMIGVETVTYIVGHFLLHTPAAPPTSV